jgi:hypothetical protein
MHGPRTEEEEARRGHRWLGHHPYRFAHFKRLHHDPPAVFPRKCSTCMADSSRPRLTAPQPPSTLRRRAGAAGGYLRTSSWRGSRGVAAVTVGGGAGSFRPVSMKSLLLAEKRRGWPWWSWKNWGSNTLKENAALVVAVFRDAVVADVEGPAGRRRGRQLLELDEAVLKRLLDAGIPQDEKGRCPAYGKLRRLKGDDREDFELWE